MSTHQVEFDDRLLTMTYHGIQMSGIEPLAFPCDVIQWFYYLPTFSRLFCKLIMAPYKGCQVNVFFSIFSKKTYFFGTPYTHLF